MVSILPMVDLLGNTAVDWFCILSYFRLDTLPDYSYIMRYVLYTGTAVVHAIPAEILFCCLKVCDRILLLFSVTLETLHAQKIGGCTIDIKLV